MVQFNFSERTIKAKVVYYGPPQSGKTTNLEQIHKISDPEGANRLISLNTAQDRTLFFDLLPFSLGSVSGYDFKIQLYTVPGQVQYNATRRVVLAGADAVVFVADSNRPMAKENLAAFENMKVNLLANRLVPEKVPLVFQYNKQDLASLIPREELDHSLNPWGRKAFPAVAARGEGVMETFVAVVQDMLSAIAVKYNLKEKGLDPEAVPAIVAQAFAEIARRAPPRAPAATAPAPGIRQREPGEADHRRARRCRARLPGAGGSRGESRLRGAPEPCDPGEPRAGPGARTAGARRRRRPLYDPCLPRPAGRAPGRGAARQRDRGDRDRGRSAPARAARHRTAQRLPPRLRAGSRPAADAADPASRDDGGSAPPAVPPPRPSPPPVAAAPPPVVPRPAAPAPGRRSRRRAASRALAAAPAPSPPPRASSQPPPGAASLDGLVADVVQAMRTALAARPVTVEIRIARGAALPRCSPTSLRRALAGLFQGLAAVVTPQSAIVLRAEKKPVLLRGKDGGEMKRDFLMLAATHAGGLAEPDQQRILRGADTGPFGETQRLVREMGGFIRFAPLPGGALETRVFLPA